MKGSKDHEKRLRLLAAWGVGRLLLNHPLEPRPAHARLVAEVPSFGKTLYIYEVTDRAPAVYLARRVFRAPHLNAAYERLSTAGFDARSDVVLGRGRPAGAARRRRGAGPEAEPGEPGGGDGVRGARRAGRPALVPPVGGAGRRPSRGGEAANLHRLGVEVPAGRHRVHLLIDRRPLVRSFWVAGIALALLPVLALLGGRRSE